MASFRVAIVTCPASCTDPLKNQILLRKYVRKAFQQKAELICFPEFSLTGYDPKKISQFAQPKTGSFVQFVQDMAAEYYITILAGFIEKSKSNHFFASQIVAFPEKKAEIYRKLHLAPPEQKNLTPGKTAPVFTQNQRTFGIELCYDAHFPLLTTRLAQKGAEIIFIPHASPNGTSLKKYHSWLRHLPARAYDNSVYILATNQCGTNEAGVQFPSLIMALGPDGKIFRKYTGATQKMLVVDLDLSHLRQIRSHPMRYFLPQHRSNIR